MKNADVLFSKNIPNSIRHIRWNWERSPENFQMENYLVRYHFVVVDDSEFDRKTLLENIFQQISKVNSGIIKIRGKEGKVKNTKMKYSLVSFDSITSPTLLYLEKFNVPVKKDCQLCERKVLNIEDYVSRIYE